VNQCFFTHSPCLPLKVLRRRSAQAPLAPVHTDSSSAVEDARYTRAQRRLNLHRHRLECTCPHDEHPRLAHSRQTRWWGASRWSGLCPARRPPACACAQEVGSRPMAVSALRVADVHDAVLRLPAVQRRRASCQDQPGGSHTQGAQAGPLPRVLTTRGRSLQRAWRWRPALPFKSVLTFRWGQRAWLAVPKCATRRRDPTERPGRTGALPAGRRATGRRGRRVRCR
jgi:hypothetical protein